MKRNTVLKTVGTIALATAATVASSHAALDAAVVTDQITAASTIVETIAVSAMGLTGLFMLWRLVRKGANRVC